jgi:hypothetical protein
VKRYAIYICGPRDDPDDPLMEFDNYFGHVPKDFNPRTGLEQFLIRMGLRPDHLVP